MLKALFKLVAITVGVGILSVLAVFLIRSMASHQVFKAPPHVWFEQATWNILNVHTPAQLEALCEAEDVDKLVPSANWIITVPLRRYQEEWRIPCKQPKLLGEFLKGQKHRDWILRLNTSDTWGLEKLIEVVAPFEQNMRFGVIAESQKVSIFLRKKAPEWLYAADSASLLRFRMFQSLGIDTAMEFWPDFVIAGNSENMRLDAYGASELQRRQKRIIWNLEDGGPPPEQISTQGIMTEAPQK